MCGKSWGEMKALEWEGGRGESMHLLTESFTLAEQVGDRLLAILHWEGLCLGGGPLM